MIGPSARLSKWVSFTAGSAFVLKANAPLKLRAPPGISTHLVRLWAGASPHVGHGPPAPPGGVLSFLMAVDVLWVSVSDDLNPHRLFQFC